VGVLICLLICPDHFGLQLRMVWAACGMLIVAYFFITIHAAAGIDPASGIDAMILGLLALDAVVRVVDSMLLIRRSDSGAPPFPELLPHSPNQTLAVLGVLVLFYVGWPQMVIDLAGLTITVDNGVYVLVACYLSSAVGVAAWSWLRDRRGPERLAAIRDLPHEALPGLLSQQGG
jgi:hypothetical protein